MSHVWITPYITEELSTVLIPKIINIDRYDQQPRFTELVWLTCDYDTASNTASAFPQSMANNEFGLIKCYPGSVAYVSGDHVMHTRLPWEESHWYDYMDMLDKMDERSSAYYDFEDSLYQTAIIEEWEIALNDWANTEELLTRAVQFYHSGLLRIRCFIIENIQRIEWTPMRLAKFREFNGVLLDNANDLVGLSVYAYKYGNTELVDAIHKKIKNE